jgi:REP element-mobilizing transposase RayT
MVMPDHLHLLVKLGSTMSLSDCIRLCKGRLAAALRAAQLSWQEGYYEHAMREQEDRVPVFLYIYLNPYKAGLVTKTQPWPGYFCAPADWDWFSQMTDRDLPFAEWLA